MLYRPTYRVFEPGAATGDVISPADMAQHLRVTGGEEAYLISTYARAAALMVEARTQRLLSARTCVLRLPSLPSDLIPVELPGGYVATVASVVVDGVTLSPGAYAVAGHSPAQLMPLAAWPSAVGEGLPVVITYTAGYTASNGVYPIPEPLRMAVMMIAAELFERRSAGSDVKIEDVPIGAKYLMEPFLIRAVG